MAQKRTIHTTRPPAVAPAGRMTIQEVAEALELSYSGVYHHLRHNEIPHQQDDSGVISIARSDLAKFKRVRRQPAAGNTRGIFLRPTADIAKRWERAIKETTKKGEEPIPVSRWLLELAERACIEAGV